MAGVTTHIEGKDTKKEEAVTVMGVYWKNLWLIINESLKYFA